MTMKKNALKIIIVALCSAALLVAIYWLIRSSLTLRQINAMQEDYGTNYAILACGSVLQIFAMALVLANLITLITFVLFKHRILRSNKFRGKLIYIELPIVLLSMCVDIAAYLVLALTRVGWAFIYSAMLLMWVLSIGTGTFFIGNIVGVIIKPKVTEEEVKKL